MIPKLKAPPWYGFSNFLGTQDRTKIRSESGDYALVSDVTAPLFSVVSAIYNVEQYLPEFLESLAQQTFDHSRVELILVNDGSLDNSLSLLEQFQSSTDYAVRVINQENAGQGAARNTGIEVAQGTWVTFPDPDDILEADYLQVVADHIELWPQAEMFATNRIMFFEDTGLIEETHPLKRLFAGGNRLTDLSITPEFFHGSAPAAGVLARFAQAALAAQAVGLGVNAGHDLNLHNLRDFVQNVPGVQEVSIGHALIADALEQGYAHTVAAYLACLR